MSCLQKQNKEYYLIVFYIGKVSLQLHTDEIVAIKLQDGKQTLMTNETVNIKKNVSEYELKQPFVLKTYVVKAKKAKSLEYRSPYQEKKITFSIVDAKAARRPRKFGIASLNLVDILLKSLNDATYVLTEFKKCFDPRAAISLYIRSKKVLPNCIVDLEKESLLAEGLGNTTKSIKMGEEKNEKLEFSKIEPQKTETVPNSIDQDNSFSFFETMPKEIEQKKSNKVEKPPNPFGLAENDELKQSETELLHLDSLKKEVIELTRKNKQLFEKLNNEQRNHLDLQVEMSKEKNSFQTMKNMLDDQLRDLRKENRELKNEIKRLKQELYAQEHQNAEECMDSPVKQRSQKPSLTKAFSENTTQARKTKLTLDDVLNNPDALREAEDFDGLREKRMKQRQNVDQMSYLQNKLANF